MEVDQGVPRLLVVEDNPDSQFLLESLLSALCTVDLASDAEEALVDYEAEPRFLTASYARLTPNGSGLGVTIANAGHPPPLVVRESGGVEEAGGAGPLLGVFPSPALEDGEVRLDAGDALVLFTDGLVDLHEGGDGLEWLRTTLSGCGGASAGDIAERVRREALPRAERLDDDQALLVLRATPAR